MPPTLLFPLSGWLASHPASKILYPSISFKLWGCLLVCGGHVLLLPNLWPSFTTSLLLIPTTITDCFQFLTIWHKILVPKAAGHFIGEPHGFYGISTCRSKCQAKEAFPPTAALNSICSAQAAKPAVATHLCTAVSSAESYLLLFPYVELLWKPRTSYKKGTLPPPLALRKKHIFSFRLIFLHGGPSLIQLGHVPGFVNTHTQRNWSLPFGTSTEIQNEGMKIRQQLRWQRSGSWTQSWCPLGPQSS